MKTPQLYLIGIRNKGHFGLASKVKTAKPAPTQIITQISVNLRRAD